jgi:peptide/nickel transport system permease protein
MRVLAGLVLACLLGPWIWPHGYEAGSLAQALQGPSWAHPLGTDELGRCILARLLHGGRLSIGVALIATLLSSLLGAGVGLGAAVLGPRGQFLMRGVDLMLSLPRLPIYLVLMQLMGTGLFNLVLVLALFGWAPLARLSYGAARSESGRPYMLAAHASGHGLLGLARVHLLPNIAPVLAVAISLDLRNRMMVEATLSYLGFGIPAPYPSWGGMVAAVQGFLLTHPWALLPPLTALFLFSFSVQQIGLGLSRRWDPRRAT